MPFLQQQTNLQQQQATTQIPYSPAPVVPNSPPYSDYYIHIDYLTEHHRLQLPIASSTVGTASFAYLAQPTVKKIVTWTAECLGQQPAVPAAYTTDPNEILLRSKVQPVAPVLGGDSVTLIWRVSGVYEYGVIDPSKVVVSGGMVPWLNGQFSDGQIVSFTSGIIDSGSGQGGVQGLITT